MQSSRARCSAINLEDMQRLRTVAKAVSKRHLSGPDTDLLELALETVYALDKLLRLLRERRAEHDLTELRLQWEETVCASWRDVVVLRRDIAAFEHKCQAIMSTRFDQQATARTIQAQQASSDTRQSSSKGRVASATLASLKLAAESVKLESSRLTLRIRSFDTEKVRHASRTLDLLIDQRQVPEHLIDEQEKLEDALPQPSVIEAKSSEVTSFLGNAALTAANASQNRVQLQSEPPVRTSSPSKTEGVVSGRDQHLNGLSSSTDDVANASATARTMSRSLQTGTRSRKTSSASLSATPNKHSSNGYRPNPRNALDVAVGDIVNRMPMTIAIKSANLADISYAQQSAAGKDLSGQYWIGDPEPRLCFCRILPSSMVMVRVGGGWQELSEFLTQHYAHLSARGLHPGDVSPSVSSAGVAANVAWLRSASGPAGSSRLRSKSSVGSLRSHEPARLFTPQQPSRIVTMPTMKRRNSLLAHTVEPMAIIIPTPTQTAIDRTQAGSSSPLQESELPASGSGSSIIIHPSSPSA